MFKKLLNSNCLLIADAFIVAVLGLSTVYKGAQEKGLGDYKKKFYIMIKHVAVLAELYRNAVYLQLILGLIICAKSVLKCFVQ